jgi:hypothetical protein
MIIDGAKIDQVITAHANWKDRLKEAIASGTCPITVEQAAKDDRCDFGKWIYSLPATERAAPRMLELARMHTEFHKQAAAILGLALAHRRPEAEAAMASGTPFTRVTTDLVMALTTWKVELLRAH